ncbi:bifunctional phosphopantothenoylcysteine decarboxylase/phosphopantothenate--cysteine ligase CoaBC [Desulfobacterota bacterium AH_259_B03_O07]|nr:bifunctional phosphopantothenoylcysteine decarboxylase/phosphopantothenate--cysteine ligase CoaBC [Desulfobacterota bacterium AH_259_B03_O07]
MSRISGKNIILGVTGGIAAYKACELVRRLVKEEATVQVVMTKNATEFVSPLTFQTLSSNRVATDMYDIEWESGVGHIGLADSADLIVIAPATAAFIGKAASGISDNLLNSVVLATRASVLICPVMNVNMYNNPVVQENIEKLKKRGMFMLDPEEGELACGWEGKGRLPDIEVILQEIENVIAPQDFVGEKIIVTAGATREFIDSIRFISNPSTGKMGYALAREGRLRGAEVVLISGKTELPSPIGVKLVGVISAMDMYHAVMEHFDWSTVVIKAAAVGDYAPSDKIDGKIKKDSRDQILKLKPTKDILLSIGEKKNGKFIVGFAAEYENIIENSMDKLKRKKADLIVANDISKQGSGFGDDPNIVYFVDESERIEELPLMNKTEIAQRVFDKISTMKNP